MINDLHFICNKTNGEFELIFSPRRADEPAAFLPALSAECQTSGGRRDETDFPPYALAGSIIAMPTPGHAPKRGGAAIASGVVKGDRVGSNGLTPISDFAISVGQMSRRPFMPVLSAEYQASGGRRDKTAFPPYALPHPPEPRPGTDHRPALLRPSQSLHRGRQGHRHLRQ